MHPKRIHIVPLGDDRDRVLDPLLANGADHVYLLPDDGDETAAVEEDIETELSGAGVSVETHAVDHLDMYAVFGLVTTLASRPEHIDDEVFVNVSTGTRIAAIGGALGCMDVSTDATPYHVVAGADGDGVSTATRPVEPHDSTGRPVATYPVDSLTRSQTAMLAVLAVEDDERSTPKKRTLIDRAIALELALETSVKLGRTLVERASNVEDSQSRAGFDDLTPNEKKSAYRTLDTMVLDRLIDDGHVEMVPAGRSDQLELTDRGENTLRAFRHKITDVISHLDERSLPDWMQAGVGGQGSPPE